MVAVGAVVAGGRSSRLSAQSEDLPVLGTLTYNLLDFDTRTAHTAHPRSLRFMGRIAMRVHSGTYVGFAVGSWVRVYEGCVESGVCSPSLYEEYSEVVNHALFVQHYLRSRWFVRGGGGIARTEVLTPNGSVIATDRHTRASVTVGTGVDLPFARRLVLTPSLDYAVLPGTPAGGPEIHWAVAYGIGVTLR